MYLAFAKGTILRLDVSRVQTLLVFFRFLYQWPKLIPLSIQWKWDCPMLSWRSSLPHCPQVSTLKNAERCSKILMWTITTFSVCACFGVLANLCVLLLMYFYLLIYSWDLLSSNYFYGVLVWGTLECIMLSILSLTENTQRLEPIFSFSFLYDRLWSSMNAQFFYFYM